MKPGGIVALLLVYAALLAAGWLAGSQVQRLAVSEFQPQGGKVMLAMMVVTVAIYVFASAIPFVPGAEIGFALLLAFGAPIAPLVYGAMVLALTIGFLLGRLVPLTVVSDALGRFGLARAAALTREMAVRPPEDSLALLVSRSPRRWVPFLLRHRYVAVFLTVNLPGNVIIGGGGGIAFLAGVSRLFSFPRYLCTVLLAVAPIPLLVILTGWHR